MGTVLPKTAVHSFVVVVVVVIYNHHFLTFPFLVHPAACIVRITTQQALTHSPILSLSPFEFPSLPLSFKICCRYKHTCGTAVFFTTTITMLYRASTKKIINNNKAANRH